MDGREENLRKTDAAEETFGGCSEPRYLLARLRSVDACLDANLDLVRRIKDREDAAVSAARSPASSPEEARASAIEAQSFVAAAAGKLREAQGRIEDLAGERRRLLERMAQTGFFENRWVNDDGRAVYLEPTGTEPPAYVLHEGPWKWAREAPPGEDPQETLERGPLIERAYHRMNQTVLLLGVPFAAYCVVAAMPEPLERYNVAVAVAFLAVLVLALPLAREGLLVRLIPAPETARRLAEESAASAQLRFIRRGETAPPSLRELTEDRLEAARREAERNTIRLDTVVRDPEDGARRIEAFDGRSRRDEDAE